jgi:hypothetical protein
MKKRGVGVQALQVPFKSTAPNVKQGVRGGLFFSVNAHDDTFLSRYAFGKSFFPRMLYTGIVFTAFP